MVVEYPCPTCGKVFKQQAHLDRHARQKIPCSTVKEHACSCGKAFTHASNLSRHKKTCHGPVMTVEQELQALRERVRRMEETQPAQTINNVNNVTQNVTQTVNQNINITLNNYGSEDSTFLESMTFADLKKLLKLTPDHETMLRMIKLVHLNDAHPENRTVKLGDKDSDVLRIYKNGKWREKPSGPLVYDIICRNRMRFVDVEGTLLKGMAKAKFEALNDYLEKVENMANAEDASLHCEHAFETLVGLVRQELV